MTLLNHNIWLSTLLSHNIWLSQFFVLLVFLLACAHALMTIFIISIFLPSGNLVNRIRIWNSFNARWFIMRLKWRKIVLHSNKSCWQFIYAGCGRYRGEPVKVWNFRRFWTQLMKKINLWKNAYKQLFMKLCASWRRNYLFSRKRQTQGLLGEDYKKRSEISVFCLAIPCVNQSLPMTNQYMCFVFISGVLCAN